MSYVYREKSVWSGWRRTEKGTPFGKPGRTVCQIKMDLKEIGQERVKRIHLAQDRDK
jgi:hypothetical protein